MPPSGAYGRAFGHRSVALVASDVGSPGRTHRPSADGTARGATAARALASVGQISAAELVADTATSPESIAERLPDRRQVAGRRGAGRVPTAVIGLVGVVIAFIGITSMFAFEQAPFYDSDEKAHLGYAHEIADFRLPEIEREPDVPDSAIQWQVERSTGRDDRYRAVWLANHPPLHYIAVAPLIWIAEATDRPDGGLLYMRLANIAFAAVGVVMTYVLATVLSGGVRRIGLAAAAIVALVPQGHTYFSRALNDGLAFAAGTGVLWAGVRCLRRPDDRRNLVLLGAVAAVAFGTRTATMMLAVFVVGAVAVLQLLTGGQPVRSRLRAAAITVGVGLGPAAVLFGWFYLRIQLLYGDFGASTFLLDYFNRAARGSVAHLLTQGKVWLHLYQRMASTAPLSWAWPRFANLIGIVAVVGTVVALVKPRPGTTRRGLVVCLLAVALITVTVAHHLAGGGSTYPRYFFPVLGVLAGLFAVAYDRLARVLPAVLVVAMAWWAIRQMPTSVDPATTLRPRDNGEAPPPVLQVLPVGDNWRLASAALIVAGALVAGAAVAFALTKSARQPRRIRGPMNAELRRRALVVLGLSSVAVAQPVLDLFGDNPEFFVAGNYGTAQIVWFAFIVALVPPALGIAAIALAMAIDRRAGTVVYAIVVALLGAALVLAVLRTLKVDPLVLVIAAAVLGGAVLAGLALRIPSGRLLLSYLAAANLAFVGIFLFTSPTSKLIAGGSSSDIGEASIPEITAPVVVIVLDEFPAATIIRPDGTINEERYPGFAELASVSTWFRNASSPFNLSHRAVPSMLDGRLGEDGVLPTYDDHPRNLFTLLGTEVPVTAYESVTSMCPPSICDPPEPSPLTQALEDASIVYGHRVLPATLRDALPAIDNSWGAYGAQEDAGGELSAESGDEDEPSYIAQVYARWQGLSADERSPRGQAGILSEHIEAISGDPALHFVHVAIPHRPYLLSRSGIATSFLPELIRDPDHPAYEFENRMEYQLHSMQVGAADALVADLLDRLRNSPTWEDTLLVITSDHGSNLTPPDIGRMTVTDANREEVYRVPLFVKAPGQTEGEIRDDSAQTIDVLPSIIDLLDIDVDWSFDGHSLFDGSEAQTPPRVSTDVDALFEIARQRAAEFPYGDDWTALAAVGAFGDLVGREVGELAVGATSAYAVEIDQADQFAQLPTPSGEMPFALSGTVRGPDRPPELLVAVNGRLAGVIGGYEPSGGGWKFLAFVGDAYSTGANTVEVFEVERSADAVTLHPAES